ncbi:MAG: hypothetical protein AAF437_16780, partial [Pseudomonadota bacterium]
DRRKTEPGRQDPLAIGPPPGASRAQRKRDPERQNMLYWLHHLARQAVMRGGAHDPPDAGPAGGKLAPEPINSS